MINVYIYVILPNKYNGAHDFFIFFTDFENIVNTDQLVF